MSSLFYLIVSVACFLTSIVFAFVRHKKNGAFKLTNALFVGVVLSSVILFIPIYLNNFKSGDCGVFETVLISIHNMIRLFIVDGEFDFIVKNLPDAAPWVVRAYSVMFSILFVCAPILTFGFVLSFFKNASAYRRYITHFNHDTFVFSELNEKSLSLAQSLYENDKKRFFVFTDVFEKDEEEGFELIETAKKLGAVCFKKDIVTIKFSFHSKNSQISFFVIGDDNTENLTQSLKLIETYKNRDNSNLYVFSTQVESEVLLSNAIKNLSSQDSVKLKVRRINEVRSLIYRNLYDKGYETIFESALDDGTNVKKINAVVIGLGQHGSEMTKALSWFGQMNGYLVQINAFDIADNAADKFTSECPELMKFSGKLDIRGEAKYTINIHPSLDIDSVDFDEKFASLPQTTYVFIALGTDEKNISAAVKIRTLCERMGYNSQIQAIVYNSEKKNALTGITNFKGQEYKIDYIGDLTESYSESVVLDSDVEAEALSRHLKWGQESDFWCYDYNYKSSVASAIHHKMKVLCGIPGADKAPKDRTDYELWGLRELEHCRWNAYTRSEGYVWGGTTEKSGRNDLAKTHNCLVPFYDLPLSDQIKDDD